MKKFALMLGLSLFAIVFMCIAPAPAEAQYHITPQGAGNRSGTSFENATTLDDLQRLTGLLNGRGGGITIYPGIYRNAQAVVAGSGTALSPIIIHGQSSNNPDFMARFTGSQFVIFGGIANVEITDVMFDDCTTCVFVQGGITNIALQDMLAQNVDTFFDGGNPGAPITNDTLSFSNIKIEGYTLSGFRLVGTSNNVLFNNIYIQQNQADYNPATPTHAAIELHDTANNVTINRTSVISRNDNVGGGDPPNTDGIWAGAETNNVTITDTFAASYTDAGIELESQVATLNRVTVVGNRSNLILTQNVPAPAPNAFTITNLNSTNPFDAHIEATDSDVDTLVAVVTDGLFETGPTMTNPNVMTGEWIVDSYRCALVQINGGIVNHGTDYATRVREDGSCPGTPKVTFTDVELGPNPNIVALPVVPDNTTVGRGIIGENEAGFALTSGNKRRGLEFDFTWYAIASLLYIMIIHFAFSINKHFELQLIVAIFIFGAIVGWYFHRFDIGFIMAVVMSLLFW